MENAFGNTVKYVTSMALSDVRLENVFGNMVLYIPASWNVVLHGQTVFGSIKEKGQCDSESKDILEIKAEAVFGALEIRYI